MYTYTMKSISEQHQFVLTSSYKFALITEPLSAHSLLPFLRCLILIFFCSYLCSARIIISIENYSVVYRLLFQQYPIIILEIDKKFSFSTSWSGPFLDCSQPRLYFRFVSSSLGPPIIIRDELEQQLYRFPGILSIISNENNFLNWKHEVRDSVLGILMFDYG